MKRIEILAYLFLFIFLLIPISKAQVGVGITSYRIDMKGNIGEAYTYTLGIMNPSSYTTNVKISFECLDCVSEVKLFGIKLFEKVEIPEQYFKIDKNLVSVPPYTNENNAVPVTIKFSPKFLITKNLRFYTPEWLNFFVKLVNKNYDGKFEIPYLTLLIGKKELSGKFVADVVSYNGITPGVMPSVAATLTMSAKGMPVGSFIFLVIIILILIFLVLRRTGIIKLENYFKKSKKITKSKK
jgi:hypothetical protein